MSGKLSKAVLSILIVLTFLLLPASPAIAQGTEIILDPTPVEVESGNSFTVTLKINDVPSPGMAAYDFRITFTPGVIEFAGEPTDPAQHEWPDPDYGTPFVFHVDNTAGYVSFIDIYTGIPAPSGDITLVVLHGTATATESATTALHFDKADIMDPDGVPISATITVGEVKVAVPSVGGTIYPPSKLAILAPWIALGVILVAGVTWLMLRRRRV